MRKHEFSAVIKKETTKGFADDFIEIANNYGGNIISYNVEDDFYCLKTTFSDDDVSLYSEALELSSRYDDVLLSLEERDEEFVNCWEMAKGEVRSHEEFDNEAGNLSSPR